MMPILKQPKLLMLLLLVLSLPMPLTLPAAHAEPVTFFYLRFPPYTWTDEQGKLAGNVVDKIYKTFDVAGIELATEDTTGRRYPVHHNLRRNPRAVVAVPPFTLEDRSAFLIGEHRLEELNLSIFWSGSAKPVSKPEDLLGESVILLSNYQLAGWREYIDANRDRIEVHDIADHIAAVRSLRSGRATYLINYREPTEFLLQSYPVEGIRSYDLATFYFHFVMPKSEVNRRILERLETAYKQLFPPL